MNLEIYFSPFIYAFLISVSASAFFIWAFPKNSTRKSERHIYKKNISRLGGVAIFISFIIAIIIDKNLIISESFRIIIVLSLFSVLFGVWDDYKELNWKIQLAFQLAIATTLFIYGVKVEYITNPFGEMINFITLASFIFGTTWVLVFINSMNWLDGIDGLSGGVAAIAAVTIFFLSMRPDVNQPPVGIISIALFGAILGFLIFNFDPSKIIIGTSGTYFLGFILASLAIFAGTKIATALVIMAVPLADFIWVIAKRIREKSSVFKSDRRHIHHRLMDIGWSQKKISMLLYLVTALFSVMALNISIIGKMSAIFIAFGISFSIIIFADKKSASVS